MRQHRPSSLMSADDPNYWEGVYSSKERYTGEKVTTEENNGESEFLKEILEAVPEKRVLDLGCGLGDVALKMGTRANEVIGVDVSQVALSHAQKKLEQAQVSNVRFQPADANKLPFPTETFDVVVSRRGPATDSIRTLREACRVLKKGGLLMELTIGEKDKHNIAQIFKRGQMFHVKQKVTVSKTKMLRRAGFKVVSARDYLATEIFHSLDDLLNRLKSAPIIPGFDVRKDRRYLERVEKELKTPRGIETQIHRVILVARKKVRR